MITVKDLTTETIEHVFIVCSPKLSEDKLILKGREIKRSWLERMLERYGSIIKIAYWDDEPAAQVMFYPEEAMPYKQNPRVGVVEIICIYNSGFQGKGVGSALMNELINEARVGLKCLGGEKPRFLVANPFNTGEGVSLENFYKDKGFREGEEELYLEVAGNYEPRKTEKKETIGIKGEAHIYYNPNCEYSYRFADSARDKVIALDESINIRLLNLWDNPAEFKADGMNLTNVNGVPILSNVNSADFVEEVKKALNC